MQKIMLLVVLLINCLPIHASEQQSWWSRNIATITGVTAAASAAIAGLTLWQWNKTVQRQKAYDKAVKDQPNLQKEQTDMQAIMTGCKQMMDAHKSFENHQVKAVAANLKIHGFIQTELGLIGTTVDNHLKSQACAPCREAHATRKSNVSRQPCPRFQAPIDVIKQKTAEKKAVIDKDLLTANNAIARDKSTDFNRRISTLRTAGAACAAVSAASLTAYLGLRAAKNK